MIAKKNSMPVEFHEVLLVCSSTDLKLSDFSFLPGIGRGIYSWHGYVLTVLFLFFSINIKTFISFSHQFGFYLSVFGETHHQHRTSVRNFLSLIGMPGMDGFAVSGNKLLHELMFSSFRNSGSNKRTRFYFMVMAVPQFLFLFG